MRKEVERDFDDVNEMHNEDSTTEPFRVFLASGWSYTERFLGFGPSDIASR
ncbi:hypothetical protein L917_14705 [Phytophthora nicotianae]|uniref:Uncharacterized protein n=1 Tax=Phytophthora nicotianae TaxID=4792 RepID=W2MRH8_PHYNI|nr:hypothetical protein L917_14705 [Phytophthora nicotianae]ETM38961.1 hypothetical protein L914_14839 [Phytophthora nicotianae]